MSFHYRVEKQRAALQEKLVAAQTVTSATTVVSAANTKSTEQLKAQMEAQLKQQRLAMQQKRLAEQQQQSQSQQQQQVTRTIIASSGSTETTKPTTVIQLSSLQPQPKTMLITSAAGKTPVCVGVIYNMNIYRYCPRLLLLSNTSI